MANLGLWLPAQEVGKAKLIAQPLKPDAHGAHRGQSKYDLALQYYEA